MSFKNIVIPLLAKSSFIKKVLDRNKKFAGIHKGESCYVFGNGASLKYFDLSQFADKIGITCGSLFLHRDFSKINVKYYYEGHPFFYYPLWVNPYTKKINKNVFGMFLKKKMSLYNNVEYFISLTNYFGVMGENVYYLHHFFSPFKSYADSRMDEKFTPMASGLTGMLGLAFYMGFTDITLVGCDYTFYPKGEGHFYDICRLSDIFNEKIYNQEYLLDAINLANIRTVTPYEGYRGRLMPHITYKELTGAEPKYQENFEIVAKSDLLTLSRSGMIYIRVF